MVMCSICGEWKFSEEFTMSIYDMVTPEDAVCKDCKFKSTVVECSVCHEYKTQDHFKVEFQYMDPTSKRDCTCNECKKSLTTVKLVGIDYGRDDIYVDIVYFKGEKGKPVAYKKRIIPLSDLKGNLNFKSICKSLRKRRNI